MFCILLIVFIVDLCNCKPIIIIIIIIIILQESVQ
jgi:hypothetical protein